MSNLPVVDQVPSVSVDQIKACLPKGINVTVTQNMVDTLNQILASDEYAEEYRNNLFTYTSVMMNPKYKIGDYLNAVRFVTCKMLGDSNQMAYAKVFPDRYARLIGAGKTDKEISAYTSAYAANQMVVQITEQSVMPLHIVNNDKKQQAINVLADIMNDEKMGARNRLDAADKLLTHLAQPKEASIEINIGQKQASMIAELRDATAELVAQQRTMIGSGYSAKQVAESKLVIEGEFTHDDDHS